MDGGEQGQGCKYDMVAVDEENMTATIQQGYHYVALVADCIHTLMPPGEHHAGGERGLQSHYEREEPCFCKCWLCCVLLTLSLVMIVTKGWRCVMALLVVCGGFCWQMMKNITATIQQVPLEDAWVRTVFVH